jgi:HEAT repeat protein/MFS family permease
MSAESDSDPEFDLEPTDVEKIRGLPWSLAMNAAVSIFAQLVFFGSGFVLFLDILGLNKTQIGFVQSVVPFTGLLAIFAAPYIARQGYKRSFLRFWFMRYVFAAFLLITPWVTASFGAQTVLVYIAGIMITFSVFRALAMTALLPWQQEYIPAAMRGKYTALSHVTTNLTGFLTVIGSGYLLKRSSDVHTFILIFGIGIAFGFLSFWTATRIPGGLPSKEAATRRVFSRDTFMPLKDKNYARFLIGIAIITLAFGPLGPFVPLYMREKVGLDPGSIVLLQVGSLIGGVLSSYIWGWAADRYGSRPVMLSGLWLHVGLPILWQLLPRNTSLSLYLAMGISFYAGIASAGWGIGSSRLLFVRLVSRENRSAYMATHNAWTGIIGGISSLLGGWILDLTAGISGRFFFIPLDQYSVMFASALVLTIISTQILRRVRADSRISVGEFAGLFFHGNPILAMESLIRYQLAGDERAIVAATERLGQARSPLTTDELIEVLSDPRFNARFEAIISIARSRGADDRLIDALSAVLEGNEPALGVIAAWAMGRIGDKSALKPLRGGLTAPYRSIQAHCARSLGTLGDTQAIPLLVERLNAETDHGLQIAFISALGHLRVSESVPRILSLLQVQADSMSRMEISLALARIVGDEPTYIRLLRHMRKETCTAASQAIADLKKRNIPLLRTGDQDLEGLLEECEQTFARQNLTHGAFLLGKVIAQIPVGNLDKPCSLILKNCADHLKTYQPERMEYLLLALHTLNAGCPP